MKQAIVFMLIGIVLGGMFMNDKLSTPKNSEEKTEIVMGHRVDSNGNFMLVTKR